MTNLDSTSTNTPENQASNVDVNLAQQNVDVNLDQQKAADQEQTNKEVKTEATNEDPNWRAFREARKKDRAEKEAAERKAAEKEAEVAALKTAMEAAFSNGPSPQSQQYQQYYGMNNEPEETEEQRLDRLVEQKLAKKEEQYRKQQEEQEQREYPRRLLRDMPDFNQVCSQENLDYLDYHYPEISRPLQRLGDGYDKWSDTYHAVKKLIPNQANAKKDAMRADINSNKPRSISSTGPSPTGGKVIEPQQETEARRAENWARMQRVMKGVG